MMYDTKPRDPAAFQRGGGGGVCESADCPPPVPGRPLPPAHLFLGSRAVTPRTPLRSAVPSAGGLVLCRKKSLHAGVVLYIFTLFKTFFLTVNLQ